MKNIDDIWNDYKTYEFIEKMKKMGINLPEMTDEEWEKTKRYIIKNNK